MNDELQAKQARDIAEAQRFSPQVEPKLFGAIEGGGTKFICAVGRSATEMLESAVVPTSDPEGTLGACVEFFAAAERKFGAVGAIGFACFGPLDLRMESSTHGYMLATPK